MLLTNDDGFESPGLARMLARLEDCFDVLVAAPHEQRSGIGHAVTLRSPIAARPAEFGRSRGFVIEGTPADCVKLALTHLFADTPPDMVVSGINSGPNVGRNVLYSGTVAAALEAVVNGIPAVSVSMDIGASFDFDLAADLAMPIIRAAASRGLPPGAALNVNIPNRPRGEILGVRLVRQGTAGFREYYVEQPPDEAGRRRFLIQGDMEQDKDGPDTDSVALAQGYIAVSALGLRLNDGRAMDIIGSWPELKR